MIFPAQCAENEHVGRPMNDGMRAPHLQKYVGGAEVRSAGRSARALRFIAKHVNIAKGTNK